MKKTIVLLTGVSLLTGLSAHAQTIAGWTFESSGLGSSTPSEIPGAATSTTNFYAEAGAEAGTAAATGVHSASSTYTSPAGNISSKSLSSQNWTQGDYYQYAFNTVGYSGLSLSFDQTGSATGPKLFKIEYSTDGFATFGTVGSDYSVLVNGSPNPTWGAASGGTMYTTTVDLSSITAIDNQASVTFRFIDDSATTGGAINGGNVGTAGTDRMDNVFFSVASVPEPSVLALLGMGGTAFMGFVRRKK